MDYYKYISKCMYILFTVRIIVLKTCCHIMILMFSAATWRLDVSVQKLLIRVEPDRKTMTVTESELIDCRL